MSITGKYELVKAHNFDALMIASGATPETIERVKSMTVQAELKDKKDEIAFKFTSGGVAFDQFTMRFDEEIEHKTPDGRQVKAMMTRKPNGGLTKVDKFPNGFVRNLDYEFNDDGLILGYTWNGGSATQHYKRL